MISHIRVLHQFKKTEPKGPNDSEQYLTAQVNVTVFRSVIRNKKEGGERAIFRESFMTELGIATDLEEK